jgi:hypothetical protein
MFQGKRGHTPRFPAKATTSAGLRSASRARPLWARFWPRQVIPDDRKPNCGSLTSGSEQAYFVGTGTHQSLKVGSFGVPMLDR